MVDVVVTTAGGVEEDIIKCFEHTYMGDFKLSGRELRKKGINRIGDLLVPNKNYCEFEDFHSYKRPDFVLDIACNIRLIKDLGVRRHALGQVIIGENS